MKRAAVPSHRLTFGGALCHESAAILAALVVPALAPAAVAGEVEQYAVTVFPSPKQIGRRSGPPNDGASKAHLAKLIQKAA
jgi:hypothetical protein